MNASVDLPAGMPGPAMISGDSHAVLVEALLAEEPVAPHRQAVVGGVDDHRVLGLPGFLQRRQDAADLLVEVGDQPVVLAELIADDLSGAGIGGQVLVPDPPSSCRCRTGVAGRKFAGSGGRSL